MNLRTKIFHLILALVAIIFAPYIKSQVTIGSSDPPVLGALLQLKENSGIEANSSRGLLFPRVNLVDEDQIIGIITGVEESTKMGHIGLTVYNLTENESVCEGLYVWNGSKWQRIQAPCSWPIDPELLNSANCYIVSPQTALSEKIPIGKAYLAWEKNPAWGTIPNDSRVTLELLWQDTQSLISKIELVGGDKGEHSAFQVTTKPNTVGNALVAVHIGQNGNNTDPIRWSWHIWVTDYDPNLPVSPDVVFSHNNGEKSYTFMDRNLGATSTSATVPTSMGLIYQWGRKDPFTSSLSFYSFPLSRDLYSMDNTLLEEVNELANDGTKTIGIKHAEVSETNTLATSILKPTTFLYGKLKYLSSANHSIANLAPFDWYTSDDTGASGNGELWGASGGKSIYDPCPKGWRVPVNSTSKSIWAQYENEDNPSGWGDTTPSAFVSFDANGITMNTATGANSNGLGFYPYGYYRIPRAFEMQGNVGAEPISVGGSFQDYYSTSTDEGESFYWTATPDANSVNAKMEYIVHSVSAFGNKNSVSLKSASRAQSASVRCVKED